MLCDPLSLPTRAFDGVDLSVRLLPMADRPRLILSHGNGFAIDGYRVFWSLLATEYELVLYDLRSHGQSAGTSLDGHSIRSMAKDHASVADACRQALGERDTFGVFHSISAIAAILAGSAQSLWDGVVLVDPPLVSLEATTGLVPSADARLAQFARTRQTHYESSEALAVAFSEGAGRNWAEGAARDMARAATRSSPDGGVELVCPGEYEAIIYEQNARTDSFGALASMKDRVAILGADADAPRALHPALNSRTAARRYGLAYEAVSGASHMLQIENPTGAVSALRTLIGRLRSG
jgi:pimeloyl-ACP methyl ester carboxylesterase